VSDTGCPAPAATSAPATISLTVNGPVIWFVDGATGNDLNSGNLGAALATVAAATTKIGANTNQRIFVYSGIYTQGATLNQDGWLIGQGVSTAGFDAIMGITPPAGTIARPQTRFNNGALTRPQLGATVTAHNNSNVRGLNLVVTGATQGLAASGRFGIAVSDFGVTSVNGNAVNLTSTSASFTNNLSIAVSGTGMGFSATGGGTVSATQDNVTFVNTISSGTGTALNVSGTTIGATRLTFRSISASGGSNGIVLNSTGSSGGLTVTGVGTTAGSGGTITNTTTRGASFISASNITLQNMNFTNAATVDGDADNSGLTVGDNLVTNASIHLQNATAVAFDRLNITGSVEQGINGHNVNGFTLSNSTLANLGNGPDEDGLHFYNMVGTCSITNTTITSSGDDNINIQNNTTPIAPPTATSNITITGGSANTGVLGSGYLMGIRGTMNTTVTINGVTANNNFSGGIVIDTFDTATSSIEILNSTSTNNNDAISLSSNNGNTKFDIHDNVSFAGTDFVRISILKAAFSTTGTLQGKIRNNPIVVTDGQTADGIFVFQAGAGALTVAITNNTFDYRGTQRAIAIQGGQDGGGTLDTTVTGNNFDIKLDGTLDAVTGIFAQAAVASPSGDNTVLCADLGGAGALRNVFTHTLGGNMVAGEMRLRQRFATTVKLPGYAGTSSDNAAVVAYLTGRNTLVNSPTATATNDVGLGGAGFISGACQLPVFP
jgi:hypothetical protein